jgi:hypothetical protein
VLTLPFQRNFYDGPSQTNGRYVNYENSAALGLILDSQDGDAIVTGVVGGRSGRLGEMRKSVRTESKATYDNFMVVADRPCSRWG